MLSLSCVTLKRILQNTFAALNKPERRRLVLLAVADVFVGVMDIAVLALLLVVVHDYTQPAHFVYSRFDHGVAPMLGFLLVLFIFKNAVAYLVQKVKFNYVYSVASRISTRNLLQYLEGSYHDYVGTDSAVHIRRISQQPIEFGHYVLSGFQQVFSESIMILLALVAIIWYDARLFIILAVVLSIAFAMLSGYVKRRVAAARENVKSGSELALQYLKEALSGYVEGNVYDKKAFLTERYSHKQRTLNKYLASLQSVQALPARLMETFAVFGLLGLISLNEFMGRHVFEMTTIAAFLAAAYKIIPGSVKILNISSQIKTYAFAAEDLSSQNAEPPASTIQPIQSIEIKNISYKHILSNVSLCAKRGELVALTGISGKGKTTLLNLLLGFLEPDGGEILINGQPTSAEQRQQSWSNTSYVKQQPFLIYENILTNITLSNEFHEQALQEAVQASGIDLGLNIYITENGKNISGGQRQRIAFARALYKNADLLLLDEPFNELDDASEKKMLQHLQQLQAKGKIIILITHNRSSLSYCTKTVSMDA